MAIYDIDKAASFRYYSVCLCKQVSELWPGSVAVSTSACHAEGREFKSRPGRQNS